MSDKKPKVPEAPKAPKAPIADPKKVEIEFTKDCIFSGKKMKKGDTKIVTKSVAELLVKLELIGE